MEIEHCPKVNNDLDMIWYKATLLYAYLLEFVLLNHKKTILCMMKYFNGLNHWQRLQLLKVTKHVQFYTTSDKDKVIW